MSHFQINFIYPWLLLLLIPALFLALFPHFRLEKKYRRTRNRIVSLVLHIIVSVLCITVLSGMTFSYNTDNDANEIIIVTDLSYSNDSREVDKNDFVRKVVEASNEDYKVGIVTFGYNQVYAAPLSNNSKKVLQDYKNAPSPDKSATDIASALKFAREKIKNPSTAKIVVVSDGVETDGNVLNVVRSLAADGIQVNAAYYGNADKKSEMQIIDTIMPASNPSVGVSFRIGVTVQSSVICNAKLKLYDNNREVQIVDVSVEGGKRDFYLDCQFEVGGMHVLRIELEAMDKTDDALNENNTYYAYINVENFNKVLILEHADGESEVLKSILTEGDNPFEVDVINITDSELPNTVDALRAYDQVILNNVSNADMPEGFIEKLYSYVYDFGGGMFTVGGNKIDKYGDTVPNAYDNKDMLGTLYQDMLPVQVINYTPPVAVMIIIDKSGSMNDSASTSGQVKIEAAKDGAKAAIKALTSRDYCGIMTLTQDFALEQSITSVMQYEKLYSVIDSIEAFGGTYYTTAIERAGTLLRGVENVERRHIILVSDGLPNDSAQSYTAAIERNYNNERSITFSVVAIGGGGITAGFSELERITKEIGHGRFYHVEDTDRLVDRMREELRGEEIKGVNYESFQPLLNTAHPVAAGINPKLVPSLGGFYGTRAKDDKSVVVALNGKYVPIYAQWQCGEGKVGSFMCDLAGSEWSSAFVNDQYGKQLVKNMVKALMPTYNIHPQDIDVGFEEDNYTTNLSVFTTLEKNQQLKVSVSEVSESGNDIVGSAITPEVKNGYSRVSVAITKPGVHKITINKLDVQNNTIGSFTTYRAFSYSKEYDMFYDAEQAKQRMESVAELGGGQMIDKAWKLFDDKKTYIHHVIDPRMAFIIISIILFLLDIIVRKFKWKWIHELVRDRKLKQSAKEN